MDPASQQAAQTLALLKGSAVPGVFALEIDATGAVIVKFNAAPSAETAARVRALLSPTPVELVWYEGSASPLQSSVAAEDDSDDDSQVPNVREPGMCAVCQNTPAPWEHSTETPANAAVAAAATWHLCGICHGLVLAGDTEGVADRMEHVDMDHAGRLDLASRIH